MLIVECSCAEGWVVGKPLVMVDCDRSCCGDEFEGDRHDVCVCVCVCVLGWVTVGVVITCHEIVPDISVMSSLLISEGLGCKVCAVF